MHLLAREAYLYVYLLNRNVACEAYLSVFLHRKTSDEAYLHVSLLTNVACEGYLYIFLFRRAPRIGPPILAF